MLVIAALEKQWPKFQAKGVSDLGILIDFSAFWQAPRTPEQDVAFKAGLKGINQW